MVNDLNVVLLTGRLTRDPDIKETKSGKAITSFSIACNRYFRHEQSGDAAHEVHYFEIETWGLTAKQCGENLKQGWLARVTGRLKLDRWQDGNGTNRSKVMVVADRVEWMPPRRAGADADGAAGGEKQSDDPEDWD